MAALGEPYFALCSVDTKSDEDGRPGGEVQHIGEFDSAVSCVDWSHEATASGAILCGSVDGLVRALHASPSACLPPLLSVRASVFSSGFDGWGECGQVKAVYLSS